MVTLCHLNSLSLGFLIYKVEGFDLISFKLSFQWNMLQFFECEAPGGISFVCAIDSQVTYGFVTALLLTLNFGLQVYHRQTGID